MNQTFKKVFEGVVLNSKKEDIHTFKQQFTQMKKKRELENEVRMLRQELEIVKQTLSQLLTDK